MEITHGAISLSILTGMHLCITPNLRAIGVDYSQNHIFLFFYYHESPSELEQELAELIASQVAADFPDIVLNSFKVEKIVLPYPIKIPDESSYIIYQRYEPTPEGEE